jgi:hypothetical protein
MNRIQVAIDSRRVQIEAARAAGKDLTRADEAAKIDLDELVAFQNKQAAIHATGVLSLEEAQLIYATLGQTPDHFNQQPLEARIVVLQLMAEVLR